MKERKTLVHMECLVASSRQRVLGCMRVCVCVCVCVVCVGTEARSFLQAAQAGQGTAGEQMDSQSL